MKVNVHGSSHAAMGIKNQDACLELTDGVRKLKLVCDGCTNVDAKNPETFLKTHNEVGAGLFCSRYALLEDPLNHEKFVENANDIMKKMLDFIGFSKDRIMDEKMVDFIAYNYCFTIFACFETEEKFYVYHLGDGVIIVENFLDNVSYIERKFGQYPPYLVNNFTLPQDAREFTKIEFSKKDVKNVGVASDGVLAVTKDLLENKEKITFDSLLVNSQKLPELNHQNTLINFINSQSVIFTDDTTMVI